MIVPTLHALLIHCLPNGTTCILICLCGLCVRSIIYILTKFNGVFQFFSVTHATSFQQKMGTVIFL